MKTPLTSAHQLEEALVAKEEDYVQSKYGRLFPNLPPQSMNYDEDLKYFEEISNNMFGPKIKEDVAAAGYTYFGQLISHDLTFDPMPVGEPDLYEKSFRNFKIPSLNLEPLYGLGPLVSPIYYESDSRNIRTTFNVFNNGKFFDLPRIKNIHNKRVDAIIPDHRNDENIIVSQLHLAFMILHNKIFKRLMPNKNAATAQQQMSAFLDAQRLVKWRYQYVIIHDYLKTVVDGKNVMNYSGTLVDDILNGNGLNKPQLKYFDIEKKPSIPVEFSHAVFRFGHSQIKTFYNFNSEFKDKPLLSTRKESQSNPPVTFIDWSKFFFNIKSDQIKDGNFSSGISNLISSKLKNVMLERISDPEKNLAYRDLMKGLMVNLPSGQNIARAMGGPVISEEQCEKWMRIGGIKNEIILNAYKGNTPLWYYILMEGSENNGQKLGPVGGHILAEVIVGLIMIDSTSYLNQLPDWLPEDENNIPFNNYSIVDLLMEAGVYNGAITGYK